MLLIGMLCTFLVSATAEFCYTDVEAACSSSPTAVDGRLLKNCNARYGSFEGLYRQLSDSAWGKAIDIIKFITKRGGRMNFNQLPHLKKNAKDSRVLELNELNSLAKALDTEKQLAEEALRLHAQTQNHPKQDASVAHYLEEKFMESQAETIRKLAGHTNDLKSLLADRDSSLSVYLFDEYLKKQL
ncbi:uncharacterized protein LOC117167431 isoform X2 [Belonocnema kinseyi]|uniref:uncharacterized protein LOC117167431 isoform X2 n=1 Tax=Belonocnema kinseyi TaxID=2817044 RepID=UPI00143DC89C|nr:uncharacterized protein LOC117167431 isoform X2 [Belonocnema kinseyi]